MNKTYQRIALCSLSVILAAQLSVNLFFADFEISVAVTLLPLFLFLTTDFPLPATTLCAAAGVFLMRLFLSFLRYGDLQAAERLFPEMIFYISYGLLLYLCDRIRQKKAAGYRMLLPFLVGIDYISNLLELLFRAGTDAFHPSTQLGIFLVAVLRTLVIACVLLVFRQYRRILLRREHEKRYQELLLLISRLNGEVLWMDKNTTLIEQTMNTSYHLYEQLKNSPALEEQARSALAVSKDIHEIKKEYLLIMRGISEVLDQEVKSDGMYLDEILNVLKNATVRLGKDSRKEVSISLHFPHRLYTGQHYAWMSIFRNLFTNALEAEKSSYVQIEVVQNFSGDNCIFQITDHGPGIPEENQPEIFCPGFSTKINYETGEVSRGLGLNLVHDLIKDQFHGTISLESVPGKTTFTITVPKTTFTQKG